jgi:hypothetical protein
MSKWFWKGCKQNSVFVACAAERIKCSCGPEGAETVADTETRLRYVVSVSSDSEPMELKEARAEYFARWEAVETFKAHELAAMTEERAWQMIRSLRTFTEPWRDPTNGTGLVEQQAVFHRRKPS